MKNIICFFFYCCAFLLIHSCEEVGPEINFEPENLSLLDTTYILDVGSIPSEQIKTILLEDFTGQTCANCPGAHEIIQEIEAAHPNQIKVIAHYNYFQDIMESLPLVSNDAIAIGEYFNATIVWPVGLIDRYDFSSDGSALLSDADYVGKTEERLLETPSCNIEIEKTYDPISRYLKAKIKIIFTSDVLLQTNISVALVENQIIASQLDEDEGEIPDYEHNNVMRTFLTNYLGDPLSESNVAGRVYEKEYEYTLPTEWNENAITIIAFVNYTEPDNDAIIQSASVE